MTSSTKDEKEEMAGAIRYIKFSRDCGKFDECNSKTKEISIHKGIIKNLTK